MRYNWWHSNVVKLWGFPILIFGNDVTNSGRVVETDNISNVTLSQIGAMYGLGANFKF